ncbi:hypothetical protein C7271_08700 [filamentous cyanobacterium CCP5]|nr:hypothetical protein C7271_08700 [filamentous cyanobacterium CCP5]
MYSACGLIGIATGIGGYGWRQATYLPTEYQLSGSALQSESFRAGQLLDQKLTSQTENNEIALSETEISHLLAEGLAARPNSKQLLQAVQGIDTSIQADRIETGVVMNLSDLPVETLPAEVQQAIARLEQTLPVLMERDVYVSITGRPLVESGRLVLDPSAAIHIGRLKLPLADLAEQVGITPTEIERSIADHLERNGISLEAITLEDGQMVIDLQS